LRYYAWLSYKAWLRYKARQQRDKMRYKAEQQQARIERARAKEVADGQQA
jgi:hypothetical protein